MSLCTYTSAPEGHLATCSRILSAGAPSGWLSGDIMTHYMLNAYHDTLEFELPQLEDAHQWKRWIDTALESPDDICDWSDALIAVNEKYLVQPRSTVALIARL